MSEIMMKGDCRVGKTLPEDVEVVSYDVGIPEEFLVRDANDKIVLIANPEILAKIRNHPKVVAALKKWKRDPRNVFQVAKDVTVVDEPIPADRLQALWDRFAHVPDKEDYEAIYWSEQSIRRRVSRNVAVEMEAIKADAAWWRETASLCQPNGGDA